MTRECQSCGSIQCDGIECYLADPADDEADPREAQMIAEQNRRAKAFWERRHADLMALRDADGSLGDPLLRKDAA